MTLLVQYTLIFASVLMLVALGGCFAEHSGVINLGLEGIMVIGALGGALMMRYAPATLPPLLLVLLAAAVMGTAYSALLGVACINFKADQTIVGTAMNMLGTAGATVLVKAINTAANPDEQLKKDYCLLTYRNELHNLSYIISLPVDELHSEECILSSTCCP